MKKIICDICHRTVDDGKMYEFRKAWRYDVLTIERVNVCMYCANEIRKRSLEVRKIREGKQKGEANV